MRAVCLCLVGILGSAEEWRHYGADPGGSKYSPLSEINRSNVKRLNPVWVFDSGDWSDGRNASARSAFETTPIVVDGVMYVATSFHRLFALDADTGKILWEFDPKFDRWTRVTLHFSRGVTYWAHGPKKRVFLGDQQGRLFSVNADTGKADPAFGNNGVLDLRQGVADRFPRTPYNITSPVSVCRDVVVTGAAIGDGEPQGPAGDIRGWDAHTGKLKWTFHTVPRPGEFGHDTWAGDSWKDRGGANAWSVMSFDEKLGLVYAPLTSPATDFYGGDRIGANLFGDSLVALDCETGKRRWHFQTVHHNLWDYDLPSQPVLMTVTREGRAVDAVAQITKTGFVFVFDRATGKSLFPIEERRIPASEVKGEQTWPTQPVPLKPKPFARQSMRLDELTTVTKESRDECLEKIKGAEVAGDLYRPVTEKPTVFFPGTNGGANWGGGSFDPRTATLYVNSMDVGAFVQLVPREGDATLPFRNRGFGRFWDSKMYSCQQPPWGALTAIDMNTGEFRWRSVLGEYDELTARGVPKTGTPNLGGSTVTAGGLVFIAATNDSRFRAFDASTGEQIWETRLPASGHATPMTYRGKSGRQYVAIAAGGGNKYNATYDSKLIAFALPRAGDPKEPRLVTSFKVPMRADYKGRTEQLPVQVAQQPVAFSHKVHAAARCTTCHKTALTASRASIPGAAECMACHRAVKPDSALVAQVNRFAQKALPVPWVRVYDLPGFVFFSHQKHAKAKVDCAACHGPVATRDVLLKEVSTSMNACMDCHHQRKAPTSCSVCHELGQ
ncbi:MAG TPA: PQQ-binding-like beta-propeller repeat protein [Bryobacteraceae bacterium]|nr:PQQ-binding-like beta-propeller repeat protein [Bryobacteraceae bacterium]